MASSSSNCDSAFSMRLRTSPMPRIRWAMRSGWKRSNWSSFSPIAANRIGLPVTALTRQRGAAARVAVELGHDDAVEVRRPSANCSATLTASWPVIASTTSRIGVRLDRLADLARARPSARASTCRRPEVSTMSTSLPSALARSSAQRAMSTGSRVGALLVDGGARLGADLDELLDGGRAVDVARRERDRRAVLLAQPAGELGRGGRLAGALQARHQDRRSAAAARTSPRPRRRPSARRAPR